MPWRGPRYPGELPTLGYHVLDWITEYLVVPDGPSAGETFEPSTEQAQFILNYYTLDPHWRGPAIRGRALNNARRVRRGILSRPKGWGKSPKLAALCLVEALGPVMLDGWDAGGEPVATTWAELGFKPKVQLVAVSEDQTANTWDPLLTMASNPRLTDAYDVEPLQTFVNVPDGIIEYVTSAATSREGFRPVFTVMDQTESWVASNGGIKLAATIRRNLAKVGGSSVETPNAYVPGEGSVAEKSHEAWKAQSEGKLRGDDGGILLDHREAPAETDPAERESLMAGLAVAYGDSADVAGGWVSLERILQDYWDPATDPQDGRRFYLNQITHAIDSWITQPEWLAIAAPEETVEPGEMITMGFDGSRKRERGVTDATALVGCRVSDGHLFPIAVWEQPEGPAGKDWAVPVPEVLAAVEDAFHTFNVIGFFADPAKWETYVTDWEAKYGPKLEVKASRDNPITWWMSGGRALLAVRATERLHNAILNLEVTHDGSSVLTRHVLNARRRVGRVGVQIAKEHPSSERKIDAAVASILAFECRAMAVSRGIGSRRKRSKTIQRR